MEEAVMHQSRVSVARLIDKPEYMDSLREHVVAAFRREHIALIDQDVEDSVCELRHLLLNPGQYEEWQDIDLVAKRKLARVAVIRVVGGNRLREMHLHPSHDVADGHYDPLKCRELELWSAIASAEYRSIESPPYKVEFEFEEVRYGTYREQYDFVPQFDIVPVENIGWAKKRGASRRLALHEENAEAWMSLALRGQRSRYAKALRRAVPDFLHWQGMQSLLPLDRQIVRFTRSNRATKEEIRAALGVAKSTFYDAWNRLDRRGFVESAREEDNSVMFHYFPVFDYNLKPIDDVSWSRIRDRNLTELMDEDDVLYDRVLHDDSFGVSSVLDWAQRFQLDAARAKMTDETIFAFDQMQRALIQTLVEKPVAGRQMSLGQIDNLLLRLGRERVRRLMFRSIKTRKPIVELLELTDVFSDQLEVGIGHRLRQKAS